MASKTLEFYLTSLDYYSASPVNRFDTSVSEMNREKSHSVPVIRIFGTTSLGQKVCLHVHDYFPYFYVPLAELKLLFPSYSESVPSVIKRFADLVNRFAKTAFAATSSASIFKITVCSFTSIYGYHEPSDFAKIYFFDPQTAKKCSEAISKGEIFDTPLSVFEAHIDYLLHFLIDFDLSGMAALSLTHFSFRKPVTCHRLCKKVPVDSPGDLWSDKDLLVKSMYNPLKRNSFCDIEIDTMSYHLNQKTANSSLKGERKWVLKALNDFWDQISAKESFLGQNSQNSDFPLFLRNKASLKCREDFLRNGETKERCQSELPVPSESVCEAEDLFPLNNSIDQTFNDEFFDVESFSHSQNDFSIFLDSDPCDDKTSLFCKSQIIGKNDQKSDKNDQKK